MEMVTMAKKSKKGCSVCGKKTVAGFKLCSTCRSYWRNKKRVYAHNVHPKVARTKKKSFWKFKW
jgi:ribosomal protein L28